MGVRLLPGGNSDADNSNERGGPRIGAYDPWRNTSRFAEAFETTISPAAGRNRAETVRRRSSPIFRDPDATISPGLRAGTKIQGFATES